MATQNGKLRIKAERLGTIREIVKLLEDVETAYNSIYAFDFLVEVLKNENERFYSESEKRLRHLDRYADNFSRKELSYAFYYDLFGRFQLRLPSLIELQNKVDIEKILLPEDRLHISKVNIQSPGFWEFLGSLNPLEQIREFLKDNHERKKDKKYRNRQEEEMGNLEIFEKREGLINKRIETLKNLGYPEEEIRQMVSSMVLEPLNRLNGHQNNGQIEGPEE